MTQETKRQHYVPEAYLNKFGFERKKDEYQVFVTLKDNLDKTFPVNTSKICVETNLYTLTGETEAKRQIIENFYDNNIEQNYNLVYEILTNDKIREITVIQKELIISTAITLLFRVTKWLTSHYDFIERVFEKALQVAKQFEQDNFIFHGEKIEINGKNPKTLVGEYKKRINETNILTQIEAAIKLIEIRKNDIICVIKIETENHSFVTSDNPIALFNFNSKMFAPFDPENVLSMPLNSKYRLIIYPNNELEESTFITRVYHKNTLAYTEVLTNNLEQLDNSERFVIGDKQTINGLKSFLEEAQNNRQLGEINMKELEKLIVRSKAMGII